MRIRVLNILLLVLILGTSCIDRFPIEGEAYNNLLVVDGLLHNGSRPYTVKLSRSAAVTHPIYIPEKNASVKISDDKGFVEVLQEVEDGVYRSDTNGIKGVSGNAYKLSIILSDGESYESQYVELKNPVEIDTVYPEFEIEPTIDPETDVYGFRFFVSTAVATTDTAYYLWRLTETYKYTAAFLITATYDRFTKPYFKPFYNNDSLYYCYKTDEIPFFQVETTAGKSTSVLQKVPLHYVSTNTNRLAIRYSLLTKQYSVNSDTYEYWKAVKEQLTNDDILFNRQLYQVRGNISNINDPAEPVMGYFTVAGLNEKRIFFDRPEGLEIVEADCAFFDPAAFNLTQARDWPAFIGYDPHGEGSGYAEKECFDCRMKGGELEAPSFWIEADSGIKTNRNINK